MPQRALVHATAPRSAPGRLQEGRLLCVWVGHHASLGDDAHLRQRWLYGTTRWKHEYSRRVAIESVNAEARTHRGHIDRGFTRVHGNVRTAILLTFAYIGLNVRILNDWYETRGLTDPWSTRVEDPEDDRIRQPLANPDRPTIRDRLTAGSDPPPKRVAARS